MKAHPCTVVCFGFLVLVFVLLFGSLSLSSLQLYTWFCYVLLILRASTKLHCVKHENVGQHWMIVASIYIPHAPYLFKQSSVNTAQLAALCPQRRLTPHAVNSTFATHHVSLVGWAKLSQLAIAKPIAVDVDALFGSFWAIAVAFLFLFPAIAFHLGLVAIMYELVPMCSSFIITFFAIHTWLLGAYHFMHFFMFCHVAYITLT